MKHHEPAIEVGTVLEGFDGEPLPKSLRIVLTALLTHMSIEGSSGVGKTQLLKAILWQLLLLWRRAVSVVAIDPMGSFVPPTINEFLPHLNMRMSLRESTPYPAWNAHMRDLRKASPVGNVLIADFDDPDVSGLRYGLLHTPEGWEHEETADAGVDFLGYLTPIENEPRRQLILRSIFGLCAELGDCTLSDATDMLVMGEAQDIEAYIKLLDRRRDGKRPVRSDLVRKFVSRVYAHFNQRQLVEITASTWTILQQVLAEPRLRKFLCESPRGNFTFEAAVNGGKSILVNAPAYLRSQKAICSLFSAGVNRAVLRRSEEQVRSAAVPFCVSLIDEASLALTNRHGRDIAIWRQKRASLIWVVQSVLAQFGSTDEMRALAASLRANTGIQCVLRCGHDDAEAIAPKLFRPRGLMVKRSYEDVTTSQGTSWAKGTTTTVSSTVSEALGQSRGISQTVSLGANRTLGFGKSRGVGLVSSQGLTLAYGRGVTQAVSESTGLTISTANGQTSVSGGGSAKSRGQSEGSSDSHGSGTSFAFGPAMDLNTLAAGSAQRGSDSSFHGSSTSLSTSIADVVSKTQSLASMQSTSIGKSKSRSVSEAHSQTESEALSRSIAESLSKIESEMESIGRSYAEAVGVQSSTSSTKTTSTGESRGESEQRGASQSRSTRRVEELYSVEEEAKVRALEISSLPARTMFVWMNDPKKGARTFKVFTPDVPQRDFLTKLGTKDYRADFLSLVAPPPAMQESAEPLVARIYRLTAEEGGGS